MITANNKAAFIVKVKDALRAEYKPESTVNMLTFGEQYGVQPKNIKIAIEELAKEGYPLILVKPIQTAFR